MKRSLRLVFRYFTITLLLVSAWTAYANVFSDDAEVRAKAEAQARAQAGCGEQCKPTSLKIDRGMFEERVEYDFDRKGHVVVVCRRQSLIFGDYTCAPGS
ncbi:MAG: hypothetical protein KF819_26295 [Labilithrix sp.]|nr:hypothetical protein [Labilithrix sp.]